MRWILCRRNLKLQSEFDDDVVGYLCVLVSSALSNYFLSLKDERRVGSFIILTRIGWLGEELKINNTCFVKENGQWS